MEAITPPTVPAQGSEDVMLTALHRCVDSLGFVIRAYRLATGTGMRVLTLERLPNSVFCVRKSVVGDRAWDKHLFILIIPSVPLRQSEHEPLDEQGIELFNLYGDMWRMGHPILYYQEKTLDARLALELDGDYGTCVIQCQVAVEVFFDSLLALLLWEEQMDPQTAKGILFGERETVRTRVKSHFSGRLGGNWNVKGKGPVARWVQELAPLRNLVVHAAYRPSRAEAIEALEIVHQVDQFLRDRLVEKRNRYKRTTLLILGPKGLLRYGVWKGQIRAKAERANEEPEWLLDFRDWFDRVQNYARSS